MSTKIYYGLRSDKSLDEVYKELVTFRDNYVRIESNQIVTMKEYLRQENKDRNLVREMYDSSFMVIPKDGYVLGYPYFSVMLKRALINQHPNLDWWQAFLGCASFYEYGYWNNTDMPEDMPEKEWDERAEAWSVIDYRPMIFQGFSFELSSFTDFLIIEK